MGYKATLLGLCLAVVQVTSHLQGSRREGRMSVPFRQGGSFNEAMWLSQNGLMGFHSDIRDFIPQPRWNGFQPWSQPRDWQDSWNDNNNFLANGNNNIDPMFENNGDPWQIYQRLNPGLNPAATSPLVPSGSPVNGLNTGGPWSLLERNSQRFPMIPNRVNAGGFVRPNAGNNMLMDRNGFMNKQFSGSSFQANGDSFAQNLGLRNDQSQWLK